MKQIRGSIAAIITPFLTNGELDIPSLHALIDMHLSEGTDALVTCGTTGEVLTLSEEERIRVITETVERVAGKIPVIAGTFSCSTREAVKMTMSSQACGADACLAVVPFFTRPTFDGIKQHFEAIADIGLPTIFYNHPSRTSLHLNLEQLVEVCDHPMIFAIKEGSGDLDIVQKFTRLSNKILFSGDDVLALPQIAAGAQGIISIIANVLPRTWHNFATAALANDIVQARTLYRGVAELCQSMVLETNPLCVKFALSLMGKCTPLLRLPLCLPRIQTQAAIRKAMAPILQQMEHKLVETCSV
jgi:4-hydroxy-tetrahydrodipicolinate synthase